MDIDGGKRGGEERRGQENERMGVATSADAQKPDFE